VTLHRVGSGPLDQPFAMRALFRPRGLIGHSSWLQSLLPLLLVLLVSCYSPACRLVLAQEDDDDDGGGEAPPAKKTKGQQAAAAAAAANDDEDDVAASSSNEPWLDQDDYGYAFFLVILCAACAAMLYKYWKNGVSSNTSASKKGEKKTSDFQQFQKNFLIGFGLNVAADWMQGPYVYKLYSFYGFSKGEIGSLFVAGFFSSMVFGTVVAGLADRFGRKRMCMVYALVYAASCLTKHSTDYWVLFSGRLLAGISTSILHSGFESWYVAQHKAENYPEDWMIETLALMSFVKGFVAILAAVASSIVAHRFGFVAPFDAAALFLVCGAVLVQMKWKENYGDRTAIPGSNFSRAVMVLGVNSKVWLLGFVQSCFEGAMYIFVFSWTPILEATTAGEDLPHGLVFGCFMVSIMIGSNLSHQLLMTRTAESVAATACAVASAALFFSALYESHYIVMSAFCLFEVCVGVYFPAIASQRAKHVPNEVRATIMGIFRIPLNLIVVLSLLNASQVGTTSMATISAGLLILAFAGEKGLAALVSGTTTLSPVEPQEHSSASDKASA